MSFMTQATVEDNLKPSRPVRIWRWLPFMTARRWQVASGLCVVAAAWFAFSENLPVRVTDETPLYIAKRNGQTGVVTTGGRIVVPFVWRSISGFDAQGMATVESVSPRCSGVINRSGDMIIPAILSESAGKFDDHDQYVGLDEDGLVIYDRNGTQLLDSEWRPLADWHYLKFDSHGLLAAKKNGDVGWIDRNGILQVRAPEGLTPHTNFELNGLAVIENDEGNEGCVDLNGNLVIAAEFSIFSAAGWIDDLHGGVARDGNLIEVTVFPPVFSNETAITCGIVDKNGRTIIPAIYDQVWPDPKNQIAVVGDANGKWGVVDFRGNVVLPLESDALSDFDETGIATAWKDGKRGWINLTGECVIPFVYEKYTRPLRASSIDTHGLVLVQKAGNWGAIDRAGRTVIPFAYSDGCCTDHDSDWLGLKLDGRWGCLDHEGRVVIPFQYDWPVRFDENGMAVTGKNGLSVVVDANGHECPMATELRLIPLVEDAVRFDSSQALQRVTADKCCLAMDADSRRGVFSGNHGLIVPMLHNGIRVTENGFVGDIDHGRGIAILEDHLPWLGGWLSDVFPESDEGTLVHYDFEGNTIWRSDQRSYDVMKAWCFLAVGIFSAWRWRRTRASERAVKCVNER